LQKEEKKKKGQTSLLPPLAEPANNQTPTFTVAPWKSIYQGCPSSFFIHRSSANTLSKIHPGPVLLLTVLGWHLVGLHMFYTPCIISIDKMI